MIDASIERRIIIGLIVSTDYLSQTSRMWNSKYLQSEVAKRLGAWCLEYYEKYEQAPDRDIEGIFLDKIKQGLPKEIAEEIEEDILPGLSEEYERQEKFNTDYLLDQTRTYFRERHLQLHQEQVQSLIDNGRVQEAENLVAQYTYCPADIDIGLDLSSDETMDKIDIAFNQRFQNIIRYPGVLGEMLNDHLIRDGFVVFLGADKRGKTWWLIDMAMRALRNKVNVAFFQAGDLSENQMLRRIGIYLNKKSDNPKYCGKILSPVKDCIYNQLGTCEKAEREGPLGIFPAYPRDVKEFRKKLNIRDIVDGLKKGPFYRPCHNCEKWQEAGSVFFREIDQGEPIGAPEAKNKFRKFFGNQAGKFRLSCHNNEGLTLQEIKAVLKTWENRDGFVPGAIFIDYIGLLEAVKRKNDFRHGKDEVLRGLRHLSLEYHCLTVSADQADAKSYEKDLLSRSNFTEDKRINAHVTAMFGLNQDAQDREKELGLLRLNELVVREGEYYTNRQVYVIQSLKQGRPYMGSFR